MDIRDWDADDCIHLHACRRLSKVFGKTRARYCNSRCSAYISFDSEEKYVTIGDAIDYAMDGASSIIGGWSAYDVYRARIRRDENVK